MGSKKLFVALTFVMVMSAFSILPSPKTAHAATLYDAQLHVNRSAVIPFVHCSSSSPNCGGYCPSGDMTYGYTFSWLGGLVHENLLASFRFYGNCSTPVTLNWVNCWRDTLDATVTACYSYPGGNGRRWVEADISVQFQGVSHSTWCAFFEDPYGAFGTLQGPEP